MASLKVMRHNTNLLNQLQVGDLVQFPRGIYSHWAVYIGEGNVMHLSVGDDDNINDNLNFTQLMPLILGQRLQKALVKIDRFLDVAGDSKAFQNNQKDQKFTPLPADKILQNAFTRLGEVGYNVLFNNCEHFASWCRYGKGTSDQADKVLSALSPVGATAERLFGRVRGVKLARRKKS